MSHTNFAHWGKRSAENIQRLIAGTDYGSSYTNANELLQDGQLVVDITIPQYMAWINNTSTDGSGNFYEGCFMGPEYSQYFSSSTNFANKWYCHVGGDEQVNVGGTTSSTSEKMCGISYNTLPGSNDFIQLKVCGIAKCDYDDNTASTNGYYIFYGDTDGKCGTDASTPGPATFAWCTNNVNQSSGGGSIFLKINATETA
jgi:hypothetical protein